MCAPRWAGSHIRNLHRHEQWSHLRQFLLPAEQNTLRYPIAKSYVGEARIWPHRLLKDLLFVCFAELPATTFSRRWDDGARHPQVSKRSKRRGGQGERALARIILGRDGMAWLPGTSNRAPR
jgi:hypothetical protein